VEHDLVQVPNGQGVQTDLEKIPIGYEQRIKSLSAELAPALAGDNKAIMAIGVEAQKQVSDFADTMLSKVKAKDSGEVGELLTSLMLSCRKINTAEMLDPNRKKSFMAKIFDRISKETDKVKAIVAKYDNLGKEVAEIATKLTEAQSNLMRDVEQLDQFYKLNIQGFRDLECYIYALQIELQKLNQETLPVARDKAEASQDQSDIQNVENLVQLVIRLDRRLHDLKLTRMIILQSMPQVRLVQSGDMAIAEKIQSSVFNTIPIWKQQLVIAVTLLRQKAAAELQKQVSDTTNDLLRMNAELLHSGSTAIAIESERGIVDIETLAEVNDKLIQTIDDVKAVQAEARGKRAEAEKTIVQLQAQLQKRIMEK